MGRAGVGEGKMGFLESVDLGFSMNRFSRIDVFWGVGYSCICLFEPPFKLFCFE